MLAPTLHNIMLYVNCLSCYLLNSTSHVFKDDVCVPVIQTERWRAALFFRSAIFPVQQHVTTIGHSTVLVDTACINNHSHEVHFYSSSFWYVSLKHKQTQRNGPGLCHRFIDID